MENLDQDPAVLVSEERARLFVPIQRRLEILISESNVPPKIEFENNSISQKNDGAIIQSGSFNISIRALVATNPLNGKIINETPFAVSIWRRQEFDLETLQGFKKEGCETPSESAFLNKDFASSEEALEFTLAQLR
ncbi:uncharacterized protein METZ01_LOCUS49849 [marine metagenome]|uniref:Uncharacterized protein n=1 Tax=marine metagenome TaxID=408172 RepID=A0A381RYR5_9ZZZZ|tara:strand:+ start:1762 stop:2169 length:408 start_codon:yes stop_codon:yes gene_type:complete